MATSEQIDAEFFRGFRFSAETSGPRLLLTGGVHGDEFEPIAALRRLAEMLTAGEISLRCGSLTILPLVNEAAFWRGDRTADDHLDLARCCPGSAEGSITERVAFKVSEFIRASDYYVDLHTGGTELSIFPMTGYVLHADPSVLDRQRAMAQAFNLPLIWGTSPELKGRTLSIARDAGVPAIYAEHGGGAQCSRQGGEDYLAGCCNLLGWLEMLDHEQPPSRVARIVEDRRPQSGHMQVCNPSPVDGYFQPAVELGQAVQAGDLLGNVFEVDHRTAYPIRATAAGTVLVLRTFPRVKQGETVGVLMEEPDSPADQLS